MPESTTRPRWFWYVPSVLLIGIACYQIWLTRSADLSPWSGGGFGMFSTADGWGNRHLQAVAIRPGIRRELEIPLTLEWLTRSTRALPSEANLRTLALALADEPTPDTGPLEAIEVRVWTIHYDPIDLAPAGALLRSLRVPFDQH